MIKLKDSRKLDNKLIHYLSNYTDNPSSLPFKVMKGDIPKDWTLMPRGEDIIIVQLYKNQKAIDDHVPTVIIKVENSRKGISLAAFNNNEFEIDGKFKNLKDLAAMIILLGAQSNHRVISRGKDTDFNDWIADINQVAKQSLALLCEGCTYRTEHKFILLRAARNFLYSYSLYTKPNEISLYHLQSVFYQAIKDYDDELEYYSHYEKLNQSTAILFMKVNRLRNQTRKVIKLAKDGDNFTVKN